MVDEAKITLGNGLFTMKSVEAGYRHSVWQRRWIYNRYWGTSRALIFGCKDCSIDALLRRFSCFTIGVMVVPNQPNCQSELTHSKRRATFCFNSSDIFTPVFVFSTMAISSKSNWCSCSSAPTLAFIFLIVRGININNNWDQTLIQ